VFLGAVYTRVGKVPEMLDEHRDRHESLTITRDDATFGKRTYSPAVDGYECLS
jgi:hypothetical protein